MVEWLYQDKGVVGIRLTGAGFGGSLVGIIDAEKAEPTGLIQEFMDRFSGQTPENPQIRILRSVDGARYLPSFLS
jgi:galactokinase